MISFIKNIFSKNKISVVSTDVTPQFDNKETLLQMNETIQSLQKRLTYIERVTWIEEPVSKNQTLDERFDKKSNSIRKKNRIF